MRRRKMRFNRAFALTVTAAMAMTACGSDDDTGASADTAAPVEAAEAPVETEAAAVEETSEEMTEDAPAEEEAPVETVDPASVADAPSTEFDFAKLDQVCAAGVDEGSFSYWATIEPDNFARIEKPFKDRYPGIKIDLLSVREEDGAGRILTSIAANENPGVDLIYGSQDGLFPIISRGLIDDQFDWLTTGADAAMVHETNMVRLFVVGLGIAYNTNLGTPADLPATWEDMIDSKYIKDIVMDPRANPWDLISIAWGEEKTIDYVTRLTETTDPIIIKGGTAGMTEVVAGGALMTTSGRADSNAELQADGAPVEMHYTELVPLRILYNGLYKDAKNPNAAACFAGWLASPEGMASFEAVEFKANVFPPEGVPESAELIWADSAEDAENANQTGIKLQEIIAPGFGD